MSLLQKYRISIQIASKDRHTELSLLLQSLRTQTFQNFDITILDESQTPCIYSNFLPILFNMLMLENHGLDIIRNELSLGVCHARNRLIKETNYSNGVNLILRVDDDVILESNYIYKLVCVIEQGYTIASGVTPNAGLPLFKRQTEKVKPIINRKDINDAGEITYYGDDCGYGYLTDEIIEAHEFRSCALFKKEVFDKIQYELNLSPVGFREEAFLSFRARDLGFKIGVDTSAIAWHLRCPSGGCRYPDYVNMVKSDDDFFRKWIKGKYAK